MTIKVAENNYDAVTHSGVFHVDDVVSTILLSWIRQKEPFYVKRTAKVNHLDENVPVFDIGGGMFDHHQVTKKREDGRVFSSTGLIWSMFKKEIIRMSPLPFREKEEILSFINNGNDFIEDRIVYPIDAMDNGINIEKKTPFGEVIRMLSYIKNKDEGFEMACSLAEPMLYHLIRNELEKEKQKASFALNVEQSRADENLSENKVLYMSEYVSGWKEIFFEKKLEKEFSYIAYPSLRGGIMAEGVPKEEHTFDNDHLFPKEWRGKSGKELQQISGIPGAIFCHLSGFCFSANSIKDIFIAVQTCKDMI